MSNTTDTINLKMEKHNFFKEYCQLLCAPDKENIFYLSNEEIVFLQKLDIKSLNIFQTFEFDSLVLKDTFHDLIIANNSVLDCTEDFDSNEYLTSVLPLCKNAEVYRIIEMSIFTLKNEISNISTIKYIAINSLTNKINSLEKTFSSYSNEISNLKINLTETIDLMNSTNDKLQQQENEVKAAYRKLNATNKNLKKTNSKAMNLTDTIDNLVPNVLTILGIFLSIVIAVVIVYIEIFLQPNGNSVVNSLLNSVIQINLARYFISAHTLGNILFLLLFMIARLTNRTILTSCKSFEWNSKISEENRDSYLTDFHSFACADCQKDCSLIQKLKNKSMYIIGFNVLMFLSYLLLYVWWIFDHYINDKRYFLFTGDFWFVISLLILIGISLAIISKKKK